MMQGLIILVLLFSLVVAVFAVQNAITVPLNFLAWHFETSLVIVILVATALGAMILGLFGLFKSVKQGFIIKGLKNRTNALSKELETTKADLTKAQTLASEQKVAPDLDRTAALNKLIAGTSPEIFDASVVLVAMDSDDLNRVREGLADYPGFWAVIAAEGELTLMVTDDQWQTIKEKYPRAKTESGWRLIKLSPKLSREGNGYLPAVLKVIDDAVSKYFCSATFSTYLVGVPEGELPGVIEKIHAFADSDNK